MPLAVKFVVDAPPEAVKRPEVIVDEAFERKPLVNVARPVEVRVEVRLSVPAVRVPIVAEFEKRFVELAVVEKRLVVVAFPSETLPVEVRFAAVSVVPSNFNEAFSSVRRVPSKYGMELVCQVVVPVPPLPVVSAVASVRAPVLEKLEVAVAPKYALLYTERMVEEARENC